MSKDKEDSPEVETEVVEEEVVEELPKSAHELELESLRGYQDKYVRLLAESENARKRYQRDLGDSIRHSVGDVICEFLRPIDQLENALKHADQAGEEVKNWAIGFQMILGQFRDALASHGVTPFDSEGKAFDPHIHEAVEMIETDSHKPGTVVEEIMRGYRMGERTLRPAAVKVAKAPKITEDKKEGEENHGE